MSIVKKVRAVEKIYQTLEKEIASFQAKSGLSCIHNCNLCCLTKNIQANPLEFLPLAYHLYKTNQAYSFLEKLEQDNHGSVCIAFNPFIDSGSCTYYNYRGLVCRLFGFSAKHDKNENKLLITCKSIKTVQSENYIKTQKLINAELKVPLASSYYVKLYAIDLKMSAMYYPINEAIKQAIEAVLFYFSYRNKRAS